MPAMTFNSLVSQVSAYLDRTDVSTLEQIPNFIYQAEQRICRESKTIGFESYVTGNLIPGVAVYQKPALWRRWITFNVGTGATNNSHTPVQLRSYEYLIANYPDPTQTGTPLYYSDKGYDNYIVAPTPDIAYPFEIAFLQLPTPITLLNQTNFLTNFAPDVLLYATLVEAIPYLKDDERMALWNAEYEKRMASLNAQDDMRIEDRQSNRNAD